MDKRPFLLIREMRKEELAFAAECTAAEGWLSENLTTLEGFFLKDPQGCLLAEENRQPIGICVGIFYGKSGFIGELIVRPAARGRGVGSALLNHGVRVLIDHGVETVYLDGVGKAVGLYERNGFRKVCRSWRFGGHLTGKPSQQVRHMVVSDLDQVIELDRKSFGAERGFFLRRRLELFPELSYVLQDGESLAGYILGRGHEGWVSAGPWVVDEDAENPVELLNAFALEAGDRTISLGILETNHKACDLVRHFGFAERADRQSHWQPSPAVPSQSRNAG